MISAGRDSGWYTNGNHDSYGSTRTRKTIVTKIDESYIQWITGGFESNYVSNRRRYILGPALERISRVFD